MGEESLSIHIKFNGYLSLIHNTLYTNFQLQNERRFTSHLYTQ